MELPHAFSFVNSWRAQRAAASSMLLALDFDGTISRIVAHYDRAELLPAARAALSKLSERSDTTVAIISGRSVEDVRRRVGLTSLHYAGNHGLEVDGPDVSFVHERAAAARPALEDYVLRLRAAFADVDGVLVEDKGLSVTVHHRMARVPDADIERDVRGLTGGDTRVRVTCGKKVVELRPAVQWDKGRTLVALLHRLDVERGPCIFAGDDLTDEDAFSALHHRSGTGVLVAEQTPSHTSASARVSNVEQVAQLLALLAVP